jgi:hypothetical protein
MNRFQTCFSDAWAGIVDANKITVGYLRYNDTDELTVDKQVVENWLGTLNAQQLSEFAAKPISYKRNALLCYYRYCDEYSHEAGTFGDCIDFMRSFHEYLNCGDLPEINIAEEYKKYFNYGKYLEDLELQHDVILAHGLKELPGGEVSVVERAFNIYPEDSIILFVGDN